METDDSDGATTWAPPRSFLLRLPPSLHEDLQWCAWETGIPKNQLVSWAVEKLVREARADLKAVVGDVAVWKAEQFRQESLRLTAAFGEVGFLRFARDQNKKG
jgi:hypothetical protein